MRTRVCDVLGIEIPILCGPTTARTASAVSEAGGLGIVEPEALAAARQLTSRPLAVETLDASDQIIFTGIGLRTPDSPLLHDVVLAMSIASAAMTIDAVAPLPVLVKLDTLEARSLVAALALGAEGILIPGDAYSNGISLRQTISRARQVVRELQAAMTVNERAAVPEWR